MIHFATKENSEFRDALTARQIHVDPPVVDRFVGGMPFAVRRADRILVGVHDPMSVGGDATGTILDSMLQSALRDAERYPNSANVYSNLGLAQKNRGNGDDAIAAFKRAITIDPNHYASLSALSRLMAERGEVDLAISYLHRILEAYPDDATARLTIANLSIQKGDFKAAETLLVRAAQTAGSSLSAHFALAVVYLATNRPAEAIQQLRIAAKINVRLPQIHQALGVAYGIKGETARAEIAFKTAISLAPQMRDAVQGLALTYLQENKFEAAVELLNEHLRAVPLDGEAAELLAESLRRLSHFDKARRIYHRLFVSIPDQPANAFKRARLINSIGACHSLDKDPVKAREFFQAAIAMAPDADPTPYNNLARTYYATNQLEMMFRILTEVQTRFPSDYVSKLLFASGFKKLERYDESLKILKELVKAGGEGARNAFADIGWILSDGRRDLPAALEILKQGHEQFPTDPLISNNLAYVLLCVGRPAEARRVLEKVKSTEHSPVLSATWGLLRLWEGNIVEGLAAYAKAEVFARNRGNNQLANTIVQKMHLEVARAYIRSNELESAKKHILLGLSSKDGGVKTYFDDLSSLREYLKL